MKRYRTALLAAVVLALLLLVPVETSSGLGISGQERIKTLDVYLDPDNTGSVTYTVHLVNGLAIEGSGDSWEAMDQMLRIADALTRPNTTVIAEMKDDKVIGFLIRAGYRF